MNFLAAFDSPRRNTKKTSVSHYWSRLITELWRFQTRYSTVLVRRPDSTISGKMLCLHIFVVFRHRSWLPICCLHISTRSIDRCNKNWVSCFSRFSLRGGTYVIFRQKMIQLERRILLCQLIDWVEIWRKSISTHHWSRLMKKLRSFEISRQSTRWWRYWNVYISFIIRDPWWVYIGFLHFSTRSIEWCNEIQGIPKFMFSQILSISISLMPMKIVQKWPSLKSEFSCSIR